MLALEGLAFCLLTYLAILDGWSLQNAENGLDGGVIGWGLATLLNRVVQFAETVGQLKSSQIQFKTFCHGAVLLFDPGQRRMLNRVIRQEYRMVPG